MISRAPTRPRCSCRSGCGPGRTGTCRSIRLNREKTHQCLIGFLDRFSRNLHARNFTTAYSSADRPYGAKTERLQLAACGRSNLPPRASDVTGLPFEDSVEANRLVKKTLRKYSRRAIATLKIKLHSICVAFLVKVFRESVEYLCVHERCYVLYTF